MNKQCSTIQTEILASNGKFSEAIEKHCMTCKNCSQVKKQWQLLSSAKLAPPIPITNDFAIIRTAQKFSQSQKRQVTIRRVLGYVAATASAVAAIYTVLFHGPVSFPGNNVFAKAWNWDSFEERAFVLDAATEISRNDITIGSPKNDKLNKIIVNEINIEEI